MNHYFFKKGFIILILSIGLIFASKYNSNAQSNLEAGIRIGDGFSIDATFPLSKAPRLHTGFYIGDDFAFGTYFDWMFSLDGGPQGLKFFSWCRP